MWPAAPPTSAPLMQPLASAVTVCAVSRSAAVTAANTNFIRSLLLGRLLNDTRSRDVPTVRAPWPTNFLTDAVLLGVKPGPILQDALSGVGDIPPSLSS